MQGRLFVPVHIQALLETLNSKQQVIRDGILHCWRWNLYRAVTGCPGARKFDVVYLPCFIIKERFFLSCSERAAVFHRKLPNYMSETLAASKYTFAGTRWK